MSDDSQLQIPAAFLALFVPPGRLRPTASREAILERFEFCEDLSQLLIEQARDIRHALGIAEDDVLERVHRGLVEPASPVSTAEAGWVVGRLAEHLGWQDVLAALDLGGAAARAGADGEAGADAGASGARRDPD